MSQKRKIAVIGLGYVGLPVAVAFAKHGYDTIGFDIDQTRVKELQSGEDRTREISSEELKATPPIFSWNPADLNKADFFIVTVPTPVDSANQPDLGALRAASRTVGGALKRGDIVVYESTVYPGATEEECVPVLEKASGLTSGVDFTVGYSPERINPGDKEHTFTKIKKVVSGQDEETRGIVADVYGSVITAGVHVAPTIKVAEAAKVIENAQRDINIAFMNELSHIFQLLDVDTGDVLEAASTKWNFLPFKPGLVGGHCIGVDPYYLTYRSEKAGYHPQVILSGRRINDSVGERIARECVRLLLQEGRKVENVLQLGLTFKEDVPDLRNSKAAGILKELNRFGIQTAVHDPWASNEEALHEYGVELSELDDVEPADAIILAVPHKEYAAKGWPLIKSRLRNGTGVVMDVKGVLDRSTAPEGVTVWRL
ncbi:nucleotide sugar dehydrogenase [Labrys sp. ZIDIC5]|uniref:nucleotide sugar dehydrogenase n=1 Tax=Labrys sedimenti TaxID=3106036 RepID=UPI002ACAFAA1|nr:nucleotide sugar dehydrogenase [Labrys sp. ZIDIC5]MDZ5452478.1 nucleotide sugar dehydrogenase [Labrys sp. ZIDIC5]